VAIIKSVSSLSRWMRRIFEQSPLIDLDASNSRSAEEGLHLGAMAGTLDVLQRH
jgi:trehalose/maltose hydrolase-like predicted phosphorylase